MYNILPETKGHIIAIRIMDYMRVQDYQTLLPHLKKRIEQHGKIRLLVELKDFNGVEILGLLKALPYALRYGKYVEKKAILTDEPWVYTWTAFLSSFSKTKVRCFPSSEGEKAREWIRK